MQSICASEMSQMSTKSHNQWWDRHDSQMSILIADNQQRYSTNLNQITDVDNCPSIFFVIYQN